MSSYDASEERHPVRLLPLTLNHVHFGLDIHVVLAVMDLKDLACLPHAPGCICGVVQVRETAVPVVDLRKKFGLPPANGTPDARIIILQVVREGAIALIGAMVDSVREVMAVEAADIAPPPPMRKGTKADFITGICHSNGRVLLILNAARLFCADKAAPFLV